jgi:DNA-binding transcriptional LysR family regulator
MQTRTAEEDAVSTRPRFTLAQLQYFVAAADTGNISLAAAGLHTSQSGMSTAIQRLERDLGCALFVRHHARGISLTADGRQLLDRARALLVDAGELQDLGRQLHASADGALAAGVFATLAPFFVPQVLPTLRSRHPGLTVTLLEADQTALQAALRAGTCDIALTYGLDVAEDMHFTEVARSRPYALVSPRHPAAGRPQATLAELAQRPMALLDLPELSHLMLGMFTDAGVPLPETSRTTSFETLRALVAAGDGFAIVNRRPRPPDATDGTGIRTVEVVDAPAVPLGLLQAASVRRNHRMQVFADACAAVAVQVADPEPPRTPRR